MEVSAVGEGLSGGRSSFGGSIELSFVTEVSVGSESELIAGATFVEDELDSAEVSVLDEAFRIDAIAALISAGHIELFT